MKNARTVVHSLFVVAVLLCGANAQAAAIFNLVESGGDVILSGSGSINLTGLTGIGDASSAVTPFMNPSFPNFRAGDTGFHNLDRYEGITGPTSFGSGGPNIGSSGSGDVFGIHGATVLYVPDGYLSGSALSGTGVWTSETFASLDVTEGTYVWSWSSDSITLNIGQVPIPAAAWLFGSALLSLIGFKRRKA